MKPKGGTPTKHPFAQLKPGDRFFVHRGLWSLEQMQKKMTASAAYWRKKHQPSWKFSVRRDIDRAHVRVIRTK